VKIAVKVCGMTDPANIRAVAALPVDMLGFIFHAPSPRHAAMLDPSVALALPRPPLRAGVFVNASVRDVLEVARARHLDIVQLHGDESPADCLRVRAGGPRVIKAIPVGEGDNPAIDALPYVDACDYLLFDTRSTGRGGSGQPFDWSLLDAYDAPRPFILSGGVSPADAPRLRAWKHPRLHGVDLNSRFETMPGIKNTLAIQHFIQELNN
jgi:phosphoribosylanthranilate isomerase